MATVVARRLVLKRCQRLSRAYFSGSVTVDKLHGVDEVAHVNLVVFVVELIPSFSQVVWVVLGPSIAQDSALCKATDMFLGETNAQNAVVAVVSDVSGLIATQSCHIVG